LAGRLPVFSADTRPPDRHGLKTAGNRRAMPDVITSAMSGAWRWKISCSRRDRRVWLSETLAAPHVTAAPPGKGKGNGATGAVAVSGHVRDRSFFHP